MKEELLDLIVAYSKGDLSKEDVIEGRVQRVVGQISEEGECKAFWGNRLCLLR